MRINYVWFMGNLVISALPELPDRLAKTGFYQSKTAGFAARFDLDSHLSAFEFSELFTKYFHCPSYEIE